MEIEALRFLLAFLAGVFLSISGSLVQNTTQNSLASPSTLGFDGGAVLCVLIAQGIVQVFDIQVPLELITFITFNILFLGLLVFTKNKKLSLQTLDMKIIILIGLAFNLFVGAIFSVIQFLFMTLNLRFPTGLWFGSFKFFYQYEIFVYGVVFLFLLYFLLRNISALRLSSIGISFARGLGVDILKNTKRQLIFFSLFDWCCYKFFWGVFIFKPYHSSYTKTYSLYQK
jgi:iron complex transport system permease protein